MKKPEEILQSRALEIKIDNEIRAAKKAAEEEAIRKDKENLITSIVYGILFGFVGCIVGYIVALIAFLIIKVAWFIIFGIFIDSHSPVPQLKWEPIFIIIVTFIGIGIGWFGGYGSHRENNNNSL